MTVIARLHNNNILSILGNVTETGGMTTKTFDFTQESLGAFSHTELSTFFYSSTGWNVVDKEVESGKGIERVLEDYFTGNYYYNMYGMGYTLPSGVTELDIVATVARSANVGIAILFGNNQGYVTTINGLVYRKDDTTTNNTSLITLGSATNKTNTNTWYKTRVKWDSTGVIKLKIWDVDTSEPSTWDVEVTDTTYSNPQMAGVHHYQRGSYGWFKDLTLTFNESAPVRLKNNGDLIISNLYKNNNFIRIDRGNLYVKDLIEGTLEDSLPNLIDPSITSFRHNDGHIAVSGYTTTVTSGSTELGGYVVPVQSGKTYQLTYNYTGNNSTTRILTYTSYPSDVLTYTGDTVSSFNSGYNWICPSGVTYVVIGHYANANGIFTDWFMEEI